MIIIRATDFNMLRSGYFIKSNFKIYNKIRIDITSRDFIAKNNTYDDYTNLSAMPYTSYFQVSGSTVESDYLTNGVDIDINDDYVSSNILFFQRIFSSNPMTGRVPIQSSEYITWKNANANHNTFLQNLNLLCEINRLKNLCKLTLSGSNVSYNPNALIHVYSI